MGIDSLHISLLFEVAILSSLESRVSIRVGDDRWLGDVVAHSGGHVRLRLRHESKGAWPQWDAGTHARCFIRAGDRKHISDATILKQQGPSVWLQMPPTWSGVDRRTEQRQLGGFRVRVH